MNAKQRYLAKQEAKEEAYYKGMEAPKTTFVDTGNGITEVQNNSDKNEPINAPVQNKKTTLQNYKPVEKVKPQDNKIIEEINDSKKLSEKKREELYDKIVNSAISYKIELISEKVIDEINILN